MRRGTPASVEPLEDRMAPSQGWMLVGVTDIGRLGGIAPGGGVASIGDRPTTALDMAFQRLTSEHARAKLSASQVPRAYHNAVDDLARTREERGRER